VQANRPVIVTNTLDSGPLTGVRQVSSGRDHTCAVLNNGQARCWGLGGAGALGAGPPGTNSDVPMAVDNASGSGPLAGVVSIDAGGDHTCARVAGGEVRCWGDNDDDQLGIGTTGGNRFRPVRVRNASNTAVLSGVQQLAVGEYHACVRVAGAQVRCWGFGEDGQLGNGGIVSSPLPVRVQV
jgi:alpha-tubulin suppressor-like RCC1 family protein